MWHSVPVTNISPPGAYSQSPLTDGRSGTVLSRLDIKTPSRAQTVVEGLYRDVERRIAASPPGLCPVEMSLSFLQLCHAQTCGKCVPCRIGLGQLTKLISQVLDGTANMDTVRIIEKTARSILRLRYYLEAPALRDLAASHTAADLDTLRALQRQAEEAPDTAALAQALFRYHRGVTFLSGNTITPLLFNAFMQVNLEFWSGYIRSVGREESLRTLARFTDLIAAGQGDRAAQLLDDGLQRFVTTL